MSDLGAALLACIGLWLLWSRWRSRPTRPARYPEHWPKVSVIVPARDEAAHIGRLAASLAALDYPAYEVIVVDDCSSDGTRAVAERYGGPRLKVVTGSERPSGWGGKQWACHQGGQAATGAILVFTDADTSHESDSLKRAVAELLGREAAMLTCLPYHDCRFLWERLSGVFHVILLSLTAPLEAPKAGRVYALGQYLMFHRAAYDAIGGHSGVKGALVEDLPLAAACLARGLNYCVFQGTGRLFSVRMYATLGEFVSGWRRNIRAGMTMASWRASAEAAFIIAAFCGGGVWPPPLWAFASTVAAVVLTAKAQARLGRFTPLGAVAFPFGLGLFCMISLLAAFDLVVGRPMLWKGRVYEGNA